MPSPVKFQLPANLSDPCAPLPLLDDGQQITMVRWIIEVSGMYRDCAARHDAAVRAYK